jgi:hypothetical protein
MRQQIKLEHSWLFSLKIFFENIPARRDCIRTHKQSTAAKKWCVPTRKYMGTAFKNCLIL